jgi:3-deoxy-manno-octulosonate cytidylyltransferase (CMP-KDO synthetase)
MLDEIKTLVVIPARYSSSRFPGKLLTNILGKPLIEWIIECAESLNFVSKIIVATQFGEKEISDYVSRWHPNLDYLEILDASCGTERTIKTFFLNSNKNYDYVISLPCDEPFISFRQLNNLWPRILNDNFEIATLFTRFFCKEDLESRLSCKIVSDCNNNSMYFSRAVIPSSKKNELSELYIYKKHIGVFIFNVHHLNRRCKDLWDDKTYLAEIESLEQNHFLEKNIQVKLFEIKHNYFGIDVPEQVPVIEERFQKYGLSW